MTVLPGTYNLTAQFAPTANVFLHGLAGSPRPLSVGVSGFNFPILLDRGGGSISHLAFTAPAGHGYAVDLNIPFVDDISVSATGLTGGAILLRGGVLRRSTVNVHAIASGTTGILAFGGTIRNATAYATGPGAVAVESSNGGTTPVAIQAVNVIAKGTAADVGAVA